MARLCPATRREPFTNFSASQFGKKGLQVLLFASTDGKWVQRAKKARNWALGASSHAPSKWRRLSVGVIRLNVEPSCYAKRERPQCSRLCWRFDSEDGCGKRVESRTDGLDCNKPKRPS
jgi:hypothetical protein